MAEIVLFTRQSQQSLIARWQESLQQSQYSSTISRQYFAPQSLYRSPNKVTTSNPKQFENLPFMKTLECLLTPIDCQTNNSFELTGVFYVPDSLINSIVKSWNIDKQEYTIQIVVRLVQVDSSKITQRLPYNINVSVNNHQCKLPMFNNTEKTIIPWHCNVPIDITPQTNLSKLFKNILKISWAIEPNVFMVGVFVVQKLTLNDLITQLKNRPVRPSDKTKELVIKSLKSDTDMGIKSMVVSLIDPLTQQRMKLPARGVECIHMHSFDAMHFLQMNEQKPTWICPLCKKQVKFENIEIDEFFLNIIQSPNLGKDSENVLLLKNGTWTDKKTNEHFNCQSIQHVDLITSSVTDKGDVNSNNDLDTVENKKIIPNPKRLKRNHPKVKESVLIPQHIAETANLKTKIYNSTKSNPIDLNRSNISILSDSASSNNAYLPNNKITKVNTKNNEHQENRDQSRPVLFVITLD